MKRALLLLAAVGPVLLSACGTSETNTPTATTTEHGTYVRTDRPVRIINGKRYVFVPGELGSNVPGRWVPEDSAAAQTPPATRALNTKQLQDLQGGFR
ncbi:MAG TPA: hypothetical protein VGI85_06415 [Chthoniobacterales bacterium]|jgi:hypothetical protein